jgi:DivIVA domain-containing protein
VVTVLGVLGVLAVLFATAVLVTRSDPLLADAPPDRADLELPPGPLSPDDVEAVRFSMAPRGYRMDEVDAVLARLAEELAERDRLLLELRDQQ